MTVESYAQAPAYTISGVGPYPIPHPYLAGTIAAYVLIEDVPTQLDVADFSVDPATAADQGNLLLTAAAAATHDGRTLWIERATPLEQGWMARDDGREAGMEAQLDQDVMGAQEDRAQINAALRARKPMAAFDPQPLHVPMVRADGLGWENGPTADEVYAAQQYATNAGESATISQKWAEGTEPGGAGTKSAKEWAQSYSISTIENAVASTASDAASADQAKVDAVAAAEASGDVLFYDTYADLPSASTLTNGQIVEVLVDETRSNQRIRYRVESSAFVFKLALGRRNIWYVHADDGSDANDGLSSLTPFATLARVRSSIKNGDEVRVLGGTFRENLFGDYGSGDYLDGVTVRAWNTLTRPVVSARNIVSGFTLTSGNVYQVTVTKEEDGSGGRCYPTMFEDGRRLYEILIGDSGVTDLASAIAAVEAKPGSFYFAGPGSASAGWTAGPKTYYVHPTDSDDPATSGKIYESAVRLRAADTMYACDIVGLTLVSGFHHDGISGPRLVDCIVLDPSRHGCLGMDGHKGTIISGNNPRYPGSNFHNAPPGGSPDLAWTGCIAIGYPYGDTNLWQSNGFFTHITSGTPPARDKSYLIDCEAHNFRQAFNFGDVTESEVVNLKARNVESLCLCNEITNINGLDVMSDVYTGPSQRPVQVAPGEQLFIRDGYIEFASWNLFYNLSGFGSATLRDLTCVLRNYNLGAYPVSAFTATSGGAIQKLDVEDAYFIADGPGGFGDDFIIAGSVTSCHFDDVMVVGSIPQSLEWDAGPRISVTGQTSLSDINDGGTVLVMPTPHKAFYRDGEGKMRPKHGAWVPGSYIFMDVAYTDYANQPRCYICVGDIITRAAQSRAFDNVYTPTARLNGVTFAEGTSECYVAVGDGGLIVKSDNLGQAWVPVTSGTSNRLLAVDASDDTNSGIVVAVGEGGTVLRSTDWGATWAAVTSGTTDRLRAVSTDNGTNWVAVGDGGRVIRSTDSGATWSAATSGSTDLHACFYSQKTSLFLIGGRGGALKTSADQGATWTTRNTFTNNRIVGFDEDETIGRIVAVCWQDQEDPLVMLTSADAVTWTPEYCDAPFQIHAICAGGSNSYVGMSFLAVGESQYGAYSQVGRGGWDIIPVARTSNMNITKSRHPEEVIGRAMTRKKVPGTLNMTE